MILLQLALNGLRPSRRVSTPHAEIYNGRSSFSLEGLALTFCGLSDGVRSRGNSQALFFCSESRNRVDAVRIYSLDMSGGEEQTLVEH
jgi:hypothetical protein